MITEERAAEYFAAHPRGVVWTRAGAVAQLAALTHARRRLSRALKRAMRDNEAEYVEGDTRRDEYAVYEQALWEIENGVIANGEGSAPQPLISADVDDPQQPRTRDRGGWSSEALRWLGWSGTSIISG